MNKIDRALTAKPCHCTALRQASRRVTQLYDKILAPAGLKITQRAVLAQIRRSEPVTIGALAETLVMDAGGLSHTLKPLVRDELITIARDPSDQRGRWVRLTPCGKDKLEESDALWTIAQQTFEELSG